MTSNVRPKTDRRKKTISKAEAMAMAGAAVQTVSETDIARKAYELFCARGAQHGSDIEDWLNAERELQRSPATARRRRTDRRVTRLD